MAGRSQYDACISGGLVLIPSAHRRRDLEVDFRRMSDAGMFYGTNPNFVQIMDRLTGLQEEINSIMRR